MAYRDKTKSRKGHPHASSATWLKVNSVKVKGFVLVAVGMLTLGSCASSSSVVTSVGTTLAASPDGEVGPVANRDHWHAAYGVFDCEKYVPSIDGSEFPDPDGIHTHADGLIHIHPFTQRASGANATLDRFLEVTGIQVTAKFISAATSFPPVRRTNGDLCPNGKPGRVRVIEFVGPTKSDPREVEDPGKLRLQKDQVIAIVFASDDQLIGPPPSVSELDAPSDAPVSFELTPERQRIAGAQPKFVAPEGDEPSKLVIQDIELGTGDAVGENSKVGIKFVLGTWSAGRVVDSNWVDNSALLGLALGRNAVVKGFEQGMEGMKVGGLRRIVIPPALGFGSAGSPPNIGPNETLILYVRLVTIEAPRFNYTGTTVSS
jgi:peptidylprolyl isomerase